MLISTVLQGTTFELLAAKLGHDRRARDAAPMFEVGAVRELGGDVVEHVIRPGDAAAGARLRDLGLPRDALVSLVVRGEEALLPRGSTRLEEGDRLLVLVRREVVRELPQLIERWRRGPITSRCARPHLHGQRAGLHGQALERGGRRPGAPARGPRESGRRARAHAARRARSARHPRRRPLRRHGADPDDGPPGQVQSQARRRLIRATDDAERAWWQEVIGACAL